MQAIQVHNLYKHFGKGDNIVRVFEGASFTVQKGELVALVAPSGAGKTTLLMMLGCVIEPDSGQIWLGEEKVYDNHWLIKDPRALRRKKIGFIFQAHYLIPFLTILENVTMLPIINGVPKKEASKRAMELLEYFEIADKANEMPAHLSGGQNQRAAIARALANDPQIILADEPTAALDRKRTIDVVKMLKKLTTDKNVAIVMVTHDESLLPFCDRVLSIENKKIIEKPVTPDMHII